MNETYTTVGAWLEALRQAIKMAPLNWVFVWADTPGMWFRVAALDDGDEVSYWAISFADFRATRLDLPEAWNLRWDQGRARVHLLNELVLEARKEIPPPEPKPQNKPRATRWTRLGEDDDGLS